MPAPSPSPISTGQVSDQAQQPPIFRRRVDIFVKDRAFDISKAKRELGFQPRVELEHGIRRTALWYKESGLLD